MENKTKEQLENKLETIELLKDERKISDDSYAVKLVEKIVFGIIAAATVAVIGYVITALLSK